MRIRVVVTIAAPPDAVWNILEPVENHVEWMADAESIAFVTEQHRGVGTEFDCLTKVGPIRLNDHMVITEWEPGRVMGIEHRGIVRGRGRFTIDGAGDASRFTWTERLRFPAWMGGPVGEMVAKPVLEAIWRRNLQNLRELVEGSCIAE
jgi:carbon monoxide dehydrogenase subunit G